MAARPGLGLWRRSTGRRASARTPHRLVVVNLTRFSLFFPEKGGRAGFSYRDNFWDTRAFYLRIGERFNDETGFVPRLGMAKLESQLGARFRPRRVSRWFREAFPHVG